MSLVSVLIGNVQNAPELKTIREIENNGGKCYISRKNKKMKAFCGVTHGYIKYIVVFKKPHVPMNPMSCHQ